MSSDTPSPAAVGDLPPQVRPVAWVFMGLGLLGMISILASLVEGRPVLNAAVLGIFIGRGLVRGGWRTAAMIFLLVALLWLASVTMSLVTAPEPRYVLLVPVGGMAVMLAWMFRVLLRGDVRRFYAARAAATSASAGDFPLPR